MKERGKLLSCLGSYALIYLTGLAPLMRTWGISIVTPGRAMFRPEHKRGVEWMEQMLMILMMETKMTRTTRVDPSQMRKVTARAMMMLTAMKMKMTRMGTVAMCWMMEKANKLQIKDVIYLCCREDLLGLHHRSPMMLTALEHLYTLQVALDRGEPEGCPTPVTGWSPFLELRVSADSTGIDLPHTENHEAFDHKGKRYA